MIWNIAALTAILSATQVAARARMLAASSDGAEMKKAKAIVKENMVGSKAALDDKIKSYVKLARDEYQSNNRQHTVRARHLAGVGTGYFYQTLYSGAGCSSPLQQTGVRLGRCHTDSTNSESYTLECDETGTLNLYSYDSADCTGDSTMTNPDSGDLGCYDQDDDDDGPFKAIAYECTTGSAPWKELGDAVIFEQYDLPSECEQGTGSLTSYTAISTGKCLYDSFDFTRCDSESSTITFYDAANCKNPALEIRTFFDFTNCGDDDGDDDLFGSSYGSYSSDYSYDNNGDDDDPWEINAEGMSCSKSSSDDDGAVCFHSTSTVELETGQKVAMSSLRVGDRVLTVTDLGEPVFADVVFLPHPENTQAAEFVTVRTTEGKTIRMTREHLLPAGSCATALDHSLLSAAKVQAGMCVQTVGGLEEVVSVSSSSDHGISTVVTSEGAGMVVVDGVVASSFGAHHSAPNTYYHVHRSVFRVLKAAGMSVSGVLGHEWAVKANLVIGDVAYSVGRMFGVV